MSATVAIVSWGLRGIALTATRPASGRAYRADDGRTHRNGTGILQVIRRSPLHELGWRATMMPSVLLPMPWRTG